MPNEALFTVTVIISLITGTAAVILSFLTLEILRRSPFGRAVFVLSIALASFVFYHATLIVWPGPDTFAEIIKSVMYSAVAVFVWIMVWNQYRIRNRGTGEARS